MEPACTITPIAGTEAVATAADDDELRAVLLSHDWKPGQYVVSIFGEPRLAFYASGGPLTGDNVVVQQAFALGHVVP